MSEFPAVRIDERSYRRVRLGYPWIFRSEVINQKQSAEIEPGSIVDFVRDKGDFAARGYYNPRPQLVGRVMTLKPDDKIERFFIFHKIENALVHRNKLFSKPFYRLIHAESDAMPGLVVDRYGDVAVVQVNTAGMEKLYPHIETALKALLQPRAIVLRSDAAAREMEGLEQKSGVVFGELADKIVQIEENDVTFAVDVLEGQKTGWFFDQRDNRRWVGALSKDASVLDVFCHTGGFGLTAAKAGAQSVTFVDSSSDALMMVDKNIALNGMEAKAQVIEGKAFDLLEKLPKMGKKYEVVSVDPPAFIKSRKDLNAGMKGYQKLAALAAPLVEKGGYLFFASCSHHADLKDLTEAVCAAFAKTGRSHQLIRTAGAAPDHPVHPMLPETGYLKALTFRFLD
jgi:23S rRNA (cytosine1962-C5)-methyltransferase